MVIDAREHAAIAAELVRLFAHTVTIERATRTTGDYGEPQETWVTVATVPANVQVRGPARTPDELAFFAQSIRVVVPGTADVRPGDRVTFGGRCYVARSVSEAAYGLARVIEGEGI
ncbi:MAG: head-tail adaptor protein [Thermomicrobium sp.]|nr:head-tail adaptor protein [Thermomicrobium sp.]MDW8059996.1 head-tail adaptor protein [Thermomicrobium sp.]